MYNRILFVRSLLFSAIVILSCPVATSARRTRLTWINGIGYNLEKGQEENRELSRLFGGQDVHFCYNPTAMAHDADHMAFVFGDLAQAGTQKLGRFTAEVDRLVEHLRKFLAQAGERGCVVHIAHSQGALITFLASQKLTTDEMRRIEVITFGGAAALRKTPETPFRRCINYYSINDPLLFIVPSAAQALRSGFVSDNDEFCFLSPRVGDPVVDHYLLAPTYAQALQWEGNRFQRQYQSPLYRSSRIAWIVTSSLGDACSQRLKTGVKAILRSILRWCIHCYLLTRRIALQIHQLVSDRLLPPILPLLSLVIEWCSAVARAWKGEEKYVPASEVIIPRRNAMV
jgi:hypothetical protein